LDHFASHFAQPFFSNTNNYHKLLMYNHLCLALTAGASCIYQCGMKSALGPGGMSFVVLGADSPFIRSFWSAKNAIWRGIDASPKTEGNPR